MTINISKIKAYWKEYGAENFSPKLNKIIGENKVRVDKKINLDKQKKELANIKSNLEIRGFDTTILKNKDIVFLDTFSHHTRIWFETMEMHNQAWTTISFSILNQVNSEKQYNSLLEILNNYKWVKVETKSLENETINITIDFIESADFNDLSEDELKRIVGIRKKHYNYPKITDKETNKAELIWDKYQLKDLTSENIDFLYKLNNFFKNDFYCLEMHHQMWKSIAYSIHFWDDFAIKYMALKEFVENYNWVEIDKLKVENESIYLTINFIEEENLYLYAKENLSPEIFDILSEFLSNMDEDKISLISYSFSLEDIEKIWPEKLSKISIEESNKILKDLDYETFTDILINKWNYPASTLKPMTLQELKKLNKDLSQEKINSLIEEYPELKEIDYIYNKPEKKNFNYSPDMRLKHLENYLEENK